MAVVHQAVHERVTARLERPDHHALSRRVDDARLFGVRVKLGRDSALAFRKGPHQSDKGLVIHVCRGGLLCSLEERDGRKKVEVENQKGGRVGEEKHESGKDARAWGTIIDAMAKVVKTRSRGRLFCFLLLEGVT